MRTPDGIRKKQRNTIKVSHLRQAVQRPILATTRPSIPAPYSKQFQDKAVEHARIVWEKAVLTNQIAKIAKRGSRLYPRKGQLLSALRRMGYLYFTEAQPLDCGILLSAVFRCGGRIHIVFDQLDADIQQQIGPVVARLLAVSKDRLAHANQIAQNQFTQTFSLPKGA